MVDRYKGHTTNLRARKWHYYEAILKSYADGFEDLPETEFEETVIRLGDVAIVAFPYELFSEIGLRIAAASPFPYTLSLSNANGSNGYFVTEDQICRGGYEVSMFLTRLPQRLADKADFALLTGTLAHLRKMKGE